MIKFGLWILIFIDIEIISANIKDGISKSINLSVIILILCVLDVVFTILKMPSQ